MAAHHASLELIVYHAGEVRVFLLPPRGSLTIGRSKGCEVVIADRSVSSRHARLEVGAETVTLVDLGSRNGIRITRGANATDAGTTSTLEAMTARTAPLPLGAVAHIGGAALVLRQNAPASVSAHRVLAAPAMRAIDDLLARAAPSLLSVLLLGETGSGKEVVALRTHELSSRRGPFQAIHCAGLSDGLLESELFGHERGAFTGAGQAKPGLLELADGGTAFLDEIGELSHVAQVKLLRVVEDRKVTRVGGTQSRTLDLRFIAATHRDLAAEVARGRFREDLFFRLSGISVRIPPLRERRSEILPLALAFVASAKVALGRETISLAPDAASVLQGHDWPGNVRELRQTIERAAVLCTEGVIRAGDLRIDSSAAPAAPPEANQVPSVPLASRGSGRLDEDLSRFERRRIEEALNACAGNQTKAAEVLGMPRRTLVYRLRALGISRPRDRQG